MNQSYEAVVIGASAGAVDALGALLPALPQNFPAPIIIVVHIPADRPSVLADIFQSRSSLKVLEADDKEPLQPGCVYFAPPNYHLLVESPKELALSNDDPVQYSRPAIDVLFESAADAFGKGLVGIVLTGANEDGAVGLRAVQRAGGFSIVQHPDEAASAIMPRAAMKYCPEAHPMKLHEIQTFLREMAA